MPVVLVATYVLRRVRQHAGAEAQPFIDVPVQAQLEVVLRQTRQIIAAGYADFVVRTATLARGAVVLGKQARRRAEGGVQIGVIQPPVDRPCWPAVPSSMPCRRVRPKLVKYPMLPPVPTNSRSSWFMLRKAVAFQRVPPASSPRTPTSRVRVTTCFRKGSAAMALGRLQGSPDRRSQVRWGRRAVALGEAAIQGHSRLQLPGEAERRVQLAIGEVTIERVPMRSALTTRYGCSAASR